MNSLTKTARLTGLLYLIIIICGIFSEMYVRANIIVPGDATATADNILASESLFRIGFVSDLIMIICDIAIAVTFYVLLKPVSKKLALIAATFRLIQACVLGVNLLNYITPLILLSGDEYLSVFQGELLNANVMIYLDAFKYGYDIALVFFGVSCLILGYLFIKSAYLPKFLGVLLIFAALSYLIGSTVLFLLPNWTSIISPIYIIAFISELTLCFWLLTKKVSIPKIN